ncbi:MAG TPA: PEP-CTERM sorting domain-containing protein [Fimbriimonadaceae bacterium]|nr:PEP-CTERM sorting domain-containing protein [Fimbriimonadaceae bacterium]
MAVNGQSTPGMAIVNGFSAAYTVQSVSMDVSLTNANLGYVGGVLGYGSDDIFVKVQGSGGTFTNYGFYHANNSSGVSGGGFFSLNTTFTSARITVSVLSNDSVQLGIDTDFNGSFDQTYTATGYSAYSLGTGAGIALYGSGAGDNYRAQGIVPEPASFAVLGLGALALLRRRRSRK